MRINKYLADQKIASRREADEWIAAGLVLVNGKKATIGMSVDGSEKIEITQKKPTLHRYEKYYKPAGVETASPTKGLFHVGRLDKDSEGLLLLTNDRRITGPLLSPEAHAEKEYEVEVLHALPAHFAAKFAGEIEIGKNEKTKKSKVVVLGQKRFSIILTEGKNRQIRRMCGHFGIAVTKLTRVRFGPLELGKMKPGETKPLSTEERRALLGAAKIPHE